MELKNFFAQDLQGNIIPSPTVYLYQAGTTTLATGLQNASGAALSNPFTGTVNGQIQFAAPDGEYDLRVTGSSRDFTMRVRFVSVDGDKVAAAAASAADAAVQAGLATTAKVAAEAARDAAQLSAGVYATTADGLAATTNGKYFSVPSPESAEYMILYLNSGGTAVEIKRYPSSAMYASGFDYSGYAWALIDSAGKIAIGIRPSGIIEIGAGVNLNDAISDFRVVEGGATIASNYLSTRDASDGYAFVLTDQNDNAVLTVYRSGKVKIGKYEVAKQDDTDALKLSAYGTQNIVCWGDSLSQGAGSSAGMRYQDQLNALLGGNKVIVTDAAGGSNAMQILCRQGGLSDTFTVSGNLIPATTTSVSVTPTIGILYASTPYSGTAKGWLNGVYGTLAVNTSNAYTFTRAVAGDAVITPPGSQFILDGWTSRAVDFPNGSTFDADYAINLFWVGTNSVTSPSLADMPQQLEQAVEKIGTLKKKFIIIGPITTLPAGNSYHTALRDVCQKLKSRFPRNFVDAHELLVYNYNPAIPQDVTDFSNDIVPTSLRSDSIHLNDAGYGIVAKAVHKLLITKGWL